MGKIFIKDDQQNFPCIKVLSDLYEIPSDCYHCAKFIIRNTILCDDSTKKFVFNKREGWFNRRYEQRDLIKWLSLRCITW